MDDMLDNTTLSTISLLESRLLRIEQILYGQSDAPQTIAPEESASVALAELERRYGLLLRHFRVYSELVKIYKSHPSLFQPPPPDVPPIDLSPEALRATVLSYASSFPSIASALTAVTSDTPIPDPKLSTDLASLLPRMKAVEATQLAQEADIAELRARSERAMRAWYETRVLRYGKFVASAESRCEKVEMGIRRQERLRDMDSAI